MVDTSEEARLALLERLELLDSAPEQEFDAVVQLAQQLTGCKIALVSLVDAHRQWFKAKAGLDVNETPRDIAFCAHAVAADDVLVVPDARQDDRFADNPLVTGAPISGSTRACRSMPPRTQAMTHRRACRWARCA